MPKRPVGYLEGIECCLCGGKNTGKNVRKEIVPGVYVISVKKGSNIISKVHMKMLKN